jgi:hypothetical protein
VEALCIAFAGIALAGCGDGEADEPPSQEDRVRAAAGAFADAFAVGDGERACSLMTPEARARAVEDQRFLGTKGCAQSISNAAQFLSEADLQRARDYKITAVTIAGDRARVVDNSAGSPTELRKLAGKWLVDAQSF